MRYLVLIFICISFMGCENEYTKFKVGTCFQSKLTGFGKASPLYQLTKDIHPSKRTGMFDMRVFYRMKPSPTESWGKDILGDRDVFISTWKAKRVSCISYKEER